MKTTTKINDDKWTIKVVSTDEMAAERDDGGDIAGLCIGEKKQILIEEDNITEKIILHELVHAYIYGLHLADTNHMTIDDFEEVVASLFAEKGEAMIAKAKKITKALKKGMK